MPTTAKEKADGFKEEGNALFKDGNFLEAIRLYAKAEAAAPKESVYPANLSAALYEAGDYLACIEAITRSWGLSAQGTLPLRLATRAAKALAHGVRADTISAAALEKHAQLIEQLENVAKQEECNPEAESVRVWREWRAIADESVSGLDRSSATHAARVRLAEIPIARRGINPMLQYYTLGQDEMLSLFDDWGPRDPYPLRAETFTKKRLSELSFLFGGVGDARNVFATLVGAHRVYKSLAKDKRAAMRIHLTLLDIHPSALARDLVVLMLMNDCMTADSGTSSTILAEMRATLVYTYAGSIMPAYAHARQQNTIRSLREGLVAVPPRLPAWLHVDVDAIPHILASLAYWQTNTSKTTNGMMAMFKDNATPTMRQMLDYPGISSGYKKVLQGRLEGPRRTINGLVDSWGPADARGMGIGEPEWSDAKVMKELKQRRKWIVDWMLDEHLSGNLPAKLGGEAEWFKATCALVPPKELWGREPQLMEEWKKNRKGMPPFSSELTAQLRRTIESTWKPNMTLFDREYSELSNKSLPHCVGYPNPPADGIHLARMLDSFNKRFGIAKGGDLPPDPDSPAFTHTMRFFDGAIDALKVLDGSIKLEIIYGGLMEELGKMRLETDTRRPKEFPRRFTRAYLSNVPDYTHGILNTAIFVVPCVQNQPHSAVASNCLLNSGIWKNDDEFCHNYSLLHPRNISKYLGCTPIRMDGIMGLISLAPKDLPRPLSELASRSDLIRWLTRVLLNTCVPGTAGTQNVPVRMPNNLAAFVRLLVHLHAVGYPGHWLGEFMQTVLSDALVTTAAPYRGTFPIPISELQRTVPARRVRLDPWRAEFENILVAAHQGLPFAISLPSDFAKDPNDIAVFEAVVQTKGGDIGTMFGPVQDNVVDIMLYKPPKMLSVDTLSRVVPGILESDGKMEPKTGTLCLFSSQESVDLPSRKVSWRLSKARAKKMREEQWVMVVYRTDMQKAVTLPLPANKWVEVIEHLDVD
ncbi:hypothetical protein R3P38DRAFT_3265860 [Favolaschia claudopus]|uniref:DUF4470 domain-containing protein n=1 Tax=Favolaschia claudopus TaxID=2862362 RepID=A0AAW0BZD0_9AGAR